jgi:hypothetical protein
VSRYTAVALVGLAVLTVAAVGAELLARTGAKLTDMEQRANDLSRADSLLAARYAAGMVR